MFAVSDATVNAVPLALRLTVSFAPLIMSPRTFPVKSMLVVGVVRVSSNSRHRTDRDGPGRRPRLVVDLVSAQTALRIQLRIMGVSSMAGTGKQHRIRGLPPAAAPYQSAAPATGAADW